MKSIKHLICPFENKRKYLQFITRILVLFLILTAPWQLNARAVQSRVDLYYISPDGDDSSEGTLENPWATVERAMQEVKPGDIILLRGGLYEIDHAIQFGEAKGEEGN